MFLYWNHYLNSSPSVTPWKHSAASLFLQRFLKSKKMNFFFSYQPGKLNYHRITEVVLLHLCWYRSVKRLHFFQRNVIKRNRKKKKTKTKLVLSSHLLQTKQVPHGLALALSPAIKVTGNYESYDLDNLANPLFSFWMILHFLFPARCGEWLSGGGGAIKAELCHDSDSSQTCFPLRDIAGLQGWTQIQTKQASHGCRPCWNIVHTLYRDYTETQKPSAHSKVRMQIYRKSLSDTFLLHNPLTNHKHCPFIVWINTHIHTQRPFSRSHSHTV